MRRRLLAVMMTVAAGTLPAAADGPDRASLDAAFATYAEAMGTQDFEGVSAALPPTLLDTFRAEMGREDLDDDAFRAMLAEMSSEMDGPVRITEVTLFEDGKGFVPAEGEDPAWGIVTARTAMEVEGQGAQTLLIPTLAVHEDGAWGFHAIQGPVDVARARAAYPML